MSHTFLRYLFILLAIGASATTDAATCRVTPDGNGNGASWSAPIALQAALAHPQCTEIWIRAGLYKPVVPVNPANPTAAERRISFIIPPGLRVYGGFAGNEFLRDQRDPVQHRSVLSGDIDNDDTTDPSGIVIDPDGNRFGNSHHVVLMDGGTALGPITPATVLDGVVITAGRANGGSSDRLNVGGGMLCRANNSGQACSPTLRNLLFSGNVAQEGAALYNLGISGGISSPQVTGVHFSANRATSYGGAIYNDGSNAGEASPLLREVRFTGNRANSYGGAVMNDGSGGGKASPRLEQVQFSGNNASYGGAIYNDASNGGNVAAAISNATFHGNTASSDGGGIYNYASSSGTARFGLTHVTFSANQASRGGAIFNAGGSANPLNAGPIIRNVILWGNSASQAGAEIFNQSAQPVIHASVIAGGCPAPATCTDVINANPLLGPLADNGGGSWTMLPGAGSPALNAANDAFCPVVDQRGVPRAQGTRCDIGAVEVEVPSCHVKGDATGSNNGSSWANAFTSLQSALGNAGCGEIRVARGVYKPAAAGDTGASFSIRPGQRVYGGFAGNEVELGQRDPGANRTVLSGDIDNNDVTDADGIVVNGVDRQGSNSKRIVLMDGTTAAGNILATTVLDGFAITGASGFDNNGGGLLCRGNGAGRACSPTLGDLLFSANLADQGGGMFNDGRNGGAANPTLTNITFRNNSSSYGGAGMYNQGWSAGESSPTLGNVTFVGNTISAMVNDAGSNGRSSPWLNHVTFSDNVGRFEGASMSNIASGSGIAEPLLTNVIVWGGTVMIPDESNCDVEICNSGATPTISTSIIAGGCPTGSLCGIGVIDADPELGPLADNGGAAPTLLPGLDGPAIDAGDESVCIDFDQRGVSRPQGAGCDIGAVEAIDDSADRIFSHGFEAR